MNETELESTPPAERINWKTKVLAIGVLVGALVGAGTAYLLTQNFEKQGRKLEISAGEGVKLALMVLGTVRSIATFKEPGK